jgi:hypothetical protein
MLREIVWKLGVPVLAALFGVVLLLGPPHADRLVVEHLNGESESRVALARRTLEAALVPSTDPGSNRRVRTTLAALTTDARLRALVVCDRFRAVLVRAGPESRGFDCVAADAANERSARALAQGGLGLASSLSFDIPDEGVVQVTLVHDLDRAEGLRTTLRQRILLFAGAAGMCVLACLIAAVVFVNRWATGLIRDLRGWGAAPPDTTEGLGRSYELQPAQIEPQPLRRTTRVRREAEAGAGRD